MASIPCASRDSIEGVLLKRVINGGEKNTTTVVFYPNHGAGFCNDFRAIRSFFFLSALYGYRFRSIYSGYCLSVVLWGDFFSVMDERLQYLQYSGQQCQGTSFQQIVRGSLNGSCYFITHMHDLTEFIFKNENCTRRMLNLFQEIPDQRTISKQLSHLLFHLKRTLREQARMIEKEMNHPLIGLQIRTGSGLADFKDSASYMTMDRMSHVNSLIESIIRNGLSNSTIFLSTDSNAVQEYMKNTTYNVVTADVYQIGHTARGRPGYDDSFIKRAVIDLYLLSRCDYLIVTKGSSFGDTAVILSSVTSVLVIS